MNKKRLEKELEQLVSNTIGFSKDQRQTIDYVFSVLLSCLEPVEECEHPAEFIRMDKNILPVEQVIDCSKCGMCIEKWLPTPKPSKVKPVNLNKENHNKGSSRLEEIREKVKLKGVGMISGSDVSYLLSRIDKQKEKPKYKKIVELQRATIDKQRKVLEEIVTICDEDSGYAVLHEYVVLIAKEALKDE